MPRANHPGAAPLLAALLALAPLACASGQPRTPSTVGEDLLALSAEYEAYVRSGRPAADFEPAGPSVTVRDGRVLIEAASTSDGAALLRELEGLGLVGGSAYGRVASGWLPVRSIGGLDDLPHLQFVRSAARDTGTSAG